MIALRDSGTITEITMKIYRYHLLKYNCPKIRFRCPGCGRYHCFTPYVDDDGNAVDIERFGRCDHECSSGYLLYPSYESNWQGGKYSALPKFGETPRKTTRRAQDGIVYVSDGYRPEDAPFHVKERLYSFPFPALWRRDGEKPERTVSDWYD